MFNVWPNALRESTAATKEIEDDEPKILQDIYISIPPPPIHQQIDFLHGLGALPLQVHYDSISGSVILIYPAISQTLCK
jgi:hypothetical protein